ncbi:NAD(P)/FAD-dependent oxidoreductase [Aliiglaciecola litoralis]|uniref:NAD(P)/FAD-dependent oxidoreductase n=1 Tax=Aliiglaciecola litoralis TaxID=582857 RepID=A0ABP3WWN1_9ALTE
MKKRIAIIGTGISGMTCGYLLHKQHDIQLFEANDYIGGHTATIDFQLDGKQYAIDTGFIVYNDWTYPNFIKLLNKLGVQGQATEMSFSVKNLAENLEYNGNTINSLFAQRRNVLRPKFYRIVRDIVRFNRLCKSIYEDKSVDEIGDKTLGAFLQEQHFSEDFCHNYILPMCAAIWSATLKDIKGFSLAFFLQFFKNHGLLNITDRPQWYTIVGGSKQYIEPLTQGFKGKIQLNSSVKSVCKTANGYQVTVVNQAPAQEFDEVIFACHSDQALSMLAEPNEAQQSILSAMPYAMNDVVLHTDTSVLPKRKLAWASWNYLLTGDDNEQTAPTSLTYNMNILQRLESEHTFCVTLNNTVHLESDKIIRQFKYAHPQFSLASNAAQKRRAEICGVAGLHFCGAYWYNGFHEDGVRSALDVCQRFGQTL